MKAAVVTQLNPKACDTIGSRKHVSLEATGRIPGRLAAGGSVYRKNQPRLLADVFSDVLFLLEKALNIFRRRTECRSFGHGVIKKAAPKRVFPAQSVLPGSDGVAAALVWLPAGPTRRVYGWCPR